MPAKLRTRLTYANVMSTIAVFVAVSTGGAYAANTIFSSDIVDGEVKTPDLASEAVSGPKLKPSAVTTDRIAGGAVTTDRVKDNNLGGRDVLDNSLKGVDIDESTLTNVGGGGPAGGDLTGTYPNPQIAAAAVGSAELANGSVGFDNFDTLTSEFATASIPPAGGVGSVRVNCPPGYLALNGGARFSFPSGDVTGSYGDLGGWTAEGQNNGTVDQDLTASVLCLVL
jgi:hypothetical protein